MCLLIVFSKFNYQFLSLDFLNAICMLQCEVLNQEHKAIMNIYWKDRLYFSYLNHQNLQGQNQLIQIILATHTTHFDFKHFYHLTYELVIQTQLHSVLKMSNINLCSCQIALQETLQIDNIFLLQDPNLLGLLCMFQ